MDKRNKMQEVVLGLGGNEGDVVATLKKAVLLIEEQLGNITLKSSLYKTEAWGVENQPDFINMVISIDTLKLPEEVLTLCLAIEKELGRNRVDVKKWHQRIIDVDVLFYGNEIIETPTLIVPHPFVQERNFVLFPLVEILPQKEHPISKKSFETLKNESKDTQSVIIIRNEI